MKLNYVGNLFVQDCHGTIIRIRCTNSLTNIKLNRLDITFQQAFPAMETIGQKMSGITFQASNLQGGRGRTARRKGRGVKARNALPWARHHNTHPDFAETLLRLHLYIYVVLLECDLDENSLCCRHFFITFRVSVFTLLNDF